MSEYNNDDVENGANNNNGGEPIDWQPRIERALRFYNSATVGTILDKCFQQEFNDSGLDIPARRELKKSGTILHEYIDRFYKKFNNRAKATIVAGDEYARKMLAALNSAPTQRIKWDRFVDTTEPQSEKIHVNLTQELIQFYTFVKENQMVLADSELQILDPKHLIRARINAAFRLNDSNKDLVLYDWTLSTLMGPGSLSVQRKTLQMNIYKYILKKYYGKNIVGMRSVIFHKEMTNYEIIDIDDIPFHCTCRKCN